MTHWLLPYPGTREVAKLCCWRCLRLRVQGRAPPPPGPRTWAVAATSTVKPSSPTRGLVTQFSAFTHMSEGNHYEFMRKRHAYLQGHAPPSTRPSLLRMTSCTLASVRKIGLRLYATLSNCYSPEVVLLLWTGALRSTSLMYVYTSLARQSLIGVSSSSY